MRSVESAIARYTLRDDGIVVARAMNPEAPRNAETAAETLDILAGLIGDQPRPVLWDQRETPRLDPEVWIKVIERVGDMAGALAILIDEGTDHKLGTFPEAIGTLLMPTRAFFAEEPAIEWLQQFQD